MMLLTLRGTPFLYQGEEIGMRNVPVPAERLQDPLAFRLHPNLSRDPSRTPMQWARGPGRRLHERRAVAPDRRGRGRPQRRGAARGRGVAAPALPRPDRAAQAHARAPARRLSRAPCAAAGVFAFERRDGSAARPGRAQLRRPRGRGLAGSRPRGRWRPHAAGSRAARAARPCDARALRRRSAGRGRTPRPIDCRGVSPRRRSASLLRRSPRSPAARATPRTRCARSRPDARRRACGRAHRRSRGSQPRAA